MGCSCYNFITLILGLMVLLDFGFGVWVVILEFGVSLLTLILLWLVLRLIDR